MACDDDLSELLFFDTFSHDINEELNLDLVQFPKPVYITELRIIPLGARVEASLGVRLGATNPSSFEIDFFVNDLTKPGASTFERLGNFMYNQNDCINMVCEGATTIPTDGLVLRGWYTTITLAVYGTLTKNVMEQIASPPAETSSQLNDSDKLEVSSVPASVDEPKEVAELEPVDDFSTPPKDPRHIPLDAVGGAADWPPSSVDDWEKSSARTRRSPGRRKSDTRRSFSRSSSRDDQFITGNAAPRDWSRSPDYQNARRLSRGSGVVDGLPRKRPRTPPMATDAMSPGYNNSRRPRSPDHLMDDQRNHLYPKEPLDHEKNLLHSPSSNPGTPLTSPLGLDNDQAVEQFELIDSDEEIGEEIEEFDLDYDETLKLFNPMDLQRFTEPVEPVKVAKEFEIVAKILSKCSGIRRKEFEGLPRDERENWVHNMERVTVHLGQIYGYQRTLCEPHVERLLESETILQCLAIGLDYDCAMSQVAYKVRHLKVGLKFAELICCYEKVAHKVLVEEKCNVFQSLFELYNEQFMAMSLQMMILKSISSVLDTKTGVLFFLGGERENGVNYYQRVLRLIEMNPKIYLKFALKALVKKLNVFETLECVLQETKKVTAGEEMASEQVLNGCLSELLDTYVLNDLGLAHSKHFVPVPQKIEIIPDEMTTRSVAHCLDSYFRAHALLEALSLLVVQRQNLTMTTNRLLIDLLKAIARNSYGFLYLVERFETTMVIVRTLLQNTTMDDWADERNEWLQVGVEIAFKLQTKFHLEAIESIEDDEFELIDHLSALFNLTTSHVGRAHILDMICMNENLQIILTLIETEKQKVTAMECSSKYKSPTLSYSVDLLDCLLRHGTNMKCLQANAKPLLAIVKSYDMFESNVSAMLQELVIYMKPLDQVKSVFSYDDAATLCDLIRKSFDFFTTFPGDLITCLRVARFMAMPANGQSEEQEDDEIVARQDYKELKHKLFLVQFYSAEGFALLVTILDKIATHFQQPKMHSANLVGTQGVLIMQVILPTVQVLRRVLMLVINARNTDFKDITPVMPLLNVYNLLHNIPVSSLGYQDAKLAQVEIIKTLLCYTQPTPIEGVDNESVRKSLWSQVIGEVIKFTMTSPATFIPGLMVLSEMLPLPIPVPVLEPLNDKEVHKILTERQLWSAYLHPQTPAIVELIQTLSPTSYPPLIMLLVRVCLQMADLGPNMSVVVARTILELFMLQPLANNSQATSHHLRILNYLGNLVGHATIKAAVLSLLTPRLMEMWSTILATPGAAESVHQQTQESVLILFQSLLDCENSFYGTAAKTIEVAKKQIVLATVIPTVEMLQGMVNSCLDHIMLLEKGDGEAVPNAVLRNLMLFTEHDVTIRILRSAMDRRRLRMLGTFRRLVAAFVEVGGVGQPQRDTVDAMIEFWRLLITIEEGQADDLLPVPGRTVVLTGQQLGVVLSYWAKEVAVPVVTEPKSPEVIPPTESSDVKVAAEVGGGENESKEAVTVEIKQNVSEKVGEETTIEGGVEAATKMEKMVVDEDVDEVVLRHPVLELREFLEMHRSEVNDPLLDKCNEIISYLEAGREATEEGNNVAGDMDDEKEAVLPPPEGIVAQYAARQVFSVVIPTDERLKLDYWLTQPNYDMELGEVEQVPCDLTELIKTCLPADTNLVADCKRILNLSVSPQSNRERTITAPCFRTRRIEMEPLGGRMEKKMFGKVPMRGRGFARTPPSRGDLFRSRPPNTSRPPSLHVDDFLALEGGGQSSGPSGYNKGGIIGGMRGRGRGRGGFQGGGMDKGRMAGGLYRQSIPTWSQQGTGPAQIAGETPAAPTHFRTATQTPQYGNDTHHYHRDNSHFVSHPRGRGFYRNRNYPR